MRACHMSRMSLANLTCVLGPDTCFCHAHARAYLCQLADVVFLHSHIVAGLSLQTGALRGFLHAAALKRSQNQSGKNPLSAAFRKKMLCARFLRPKTRTQELGPKTAARAAFQPECLTSLRQGGKHTLQRPGDQSTRPGCLKNRHSTHTPSR